MALKLPHAVYVHLPKTGGWFVRNVLEKQGLNRGEVGREHDPANLIYGKNGKRPFTFIFIRHPVEWYRSYWAYRAMNDWRISPHQPITGWQLFGSVLDNDCRSNDFQTWVDNVFAQVPQGILSIVYGVYTDGVDFIGRVENMREDLCVALELAGESFDRGLIHSFPKQNASHREWLERAVYGEGQEKRLLEIESEALNYWECAAKANAANSFGYQAKRIFSQSRIAIARTGLKGFFRMLSPGNSKGVMVKNYSPEH